jgi:aryl-alcohol dehydrogenase-like predicted oxidoreductase
VRYKLLGNSGLRVSELCLGTMSFGEDWGWGADEAECGRIVKSFAAAGGNFIDTASLYTNGTAEQYVGDLVRADRDRWVLATKYSFTRDPRDPNAAGNHRKNLVHSLEASLRRLGTDYLDLYWVHIWDYLTPVEEVMRALDDQVRAGKILYVGISDTPAWLVSQANTLAALRGWSPFVALQVQYSLVERTVEREFLPMARALDLALTAWSPLGSGVLSGKYERGARLSGAQARLANPGTDAESVLTERNFAIVDVVRQVADEVGAKPAQVALAWLGSRPGVVIPIVGVRNEQQLASNIGALDVVLDDAQLARLDEVSRVPLGFPHEFANSVAPFGYGHSYRDIADHRAARSPRA